MQRPRLTDHPLLTPSNHSRRQNCRAVASNRLATTSNRLPSRRRSFGKPANGADSPMPRPWLESPLPRLGVDSPSPPRAPARLWPIARTHDRSIAQHTATNLATASSQRSGSAAGRNRCSWRNLCARPLHSIVGLRCFYLTLFD
jgi:hypothetical protein